MFETGIILLWSRTAANACGPEQLQMLQKQDRRQSIAEGIFTPSQLVALGGVTVIWYPQKFSTRGMKSPVIWYQGGGGGGGGGSISPHQNNLANIFGTPMIWYPMASVHGGYRLSPCREGNFTVQLAGVTTMDRFHHCGQVSAL